MLEDFIESNQLQAKIIEAPAKGGVARCNLFFAGTKTVIAVHLAKERLNQEKLMLALDTGDLQSADDTKAMDTTGYSLEFIPPISVYGVTLVLDKKIETYEKLRFPIAEEKTLEISAEEILQSNEESIVADITN